jgi:hypothetical protein
MASQWNRGIAARISAGCMLAIGYRPQAWSAVSSGIDDGSSCAASQASMPWARTSSASAADGPKVTRRRRWITGSSVARTVATETSVASAASLAESKTMAGACETGVSPVEA